MKKCKECQRYYAEYTMRSPDHCGKCYDKIFTSDYDKDKLPPPNKNLDKQE